MATLSELREQNIEEGRENSLKRGVENPNLGGTPIGSTTRPAPENKPPIWESHSVLFAIGLSTILISVLIVVSYVLTNRKLKRNTH